MSPFLAGGALAAVAVLVLIELLVILPQLGVLAMAGIAAWFAAPGVLFVRRALGNDATARASAWLLGPALGFGFSVFGLLIVWAGGLQNWAALLFAPLFTVALAWIAGRFGGAALRLPDLGRRDIVGVACALAVVPLITFAPYENVREPMADGDAYRAYFTADFVWAMTVTAELAKGDVPPANPFHYGQPMRYYWMSHLLSGAVYRNVHAWGVGSEPVVLVNGLAFGLAFVSFFYWLARAAGANAVWASLAVIAGFTANSYEGADMIRAIVTHGYSWEQLRDTNIDAVTRWFYRGMAVDGLQRLLLYQPHHLTGYVMALGALWLTAGARRVDNISIALWSGILLALAFLFSTFSAIILAPATALVYGLRLVQQASIRSAFHSAVLGAAPLAVGIAVAQTLGYTDTSDGLLLHVGVNPVALENWRTVLVLSFGPLLVFGLPGVLRLRWAAEAGTAAAALVPVAFAFYFFTDVPDMGGVWVGWRSGHMLLIAFAVASAAALTAWCRRNTVRYALAAAFAIATVVAVPTVAVDVYNAQDVSNRGQGASFPWTLVLSPAERAGLDWIRTHTPPDALVQPEPIVRGAGTWAYVPAFAERRMAAGLPISMIPLMPYQQTSEVVRGGIFQAASAADAHTIARTLGIDYLLIGDAERGAYAAGIAQIASRADLFAPVFDNEALTILQVSETPPTDAARP